MAEVRIQGLTKRYGSVTAVDGIDLHVHDGEFLTLLGPSGCGKSTTLAAVAGLERPDEGSIRVGDAVFFDSRTRAYLAPERRNCGLVFQSYALWPHMTVADNCAFALKLRRMPTARRKARVDEVLRLVEMERYADRFPHQLSGGQQQRVALARTLAYEPSILLLDEPLSNLDAKLRERARTWLAQITKKVGLTTIYVTHDQSEALALSDRVAVMREGRISQLGTPRAIYEAPADPFVADFIGSSNFFPGTARSDGTEPPRLRVRLAGGVEVGASMRHPVRDGAEVVVAIRPERIEVKAEPGPGRLEARVVERAYLGARTLYHLEVGPLSLRAESPLALEAATVFVELPAEDCVSFPGRGEPA